MNFRKTILQLLGGMAVLMVLRGSDPFPAQEGLPEARLEICGVGLKAELASTYDQWIVGLGHRTRLENGHGMLFIFDKVRSLALEVPSGWFTENKIAVGCKVSGIELL